MKSRFTSKTDAASVQRLRAAGCPMPLPEMQEQKSDLKIEVSRPEITTAYDMRAGTEYVFGVRITNVSYSRLLLQRFRARLPWTARLHWLSDPRIYAPKMGAYRLDSGRKFSCYEVLNHRVREQGGLNHGDSIEGVLLALTRNRIPMELLHGTIAPAQLSVEDQFGREHDSEIEILIDRRATMRPPVFRPRVKALFDDTEPRTGTNISNEVQLLEETQPNAPHGSRIQNEPERVAGNAAERE